MISGDCYIYTVNVPVAHTEVNNISDPIIFQPVPWPPLSMVQKRPFAGRVGNQYQVCGPIYKLIREMSILLHRRYVAYSGL